MAAEYQHMLSVTKHHTVIVAYTSELADPVAAAKEADEYGELYEFFHASDETVDGWWDVETDPEYMERDLGASSTGRRWMGANLLAAMGCRTEGTDAP